MLLGKLTISLGVICSFFVIAPYTTAVAAEKKRATLEVKERKRAKKRKRVTPGLRKTAISAIKVERSLIKGIDKTVRYLNKTASSLPKKSAKRLQILEKILNLHMEQASYQRSEEERIYDAKWQRWERTRRGSEPKLNTRKSNNDWKAVIKQATKILKEYPKSKSADLITFNKAIGLQYLKKEKASARIYSELIQKYPNSNVAGDAYSSLGDYFFDRNDFRNAESNYKKALKYRRSKRYLWSVFKLGWCTYNLGRYRAGLNYWKQLVRQARSQGKKGMQLRDEALRDMVYAFAELKDINGAIAYYRANGGQKHIGPFLLLLSTILSDQGRYSSAISVLKRYQRLGARDPKAPESQKEVISLYYALSKMRFVWQELGRFPLLYGPKSLWARRNDKKVVAETQAMIKDQIVYYSTLTHQKAIKDNNRALNLEARKGYLLFLQTYPKDPEVAGIKYLLADIAYFLKNYKEAGRYYLEIANMGKKKAIRVDPKTKKATNIHREVSIDMVRSYVKDFEKEFKVLKKRKPNFKRPRPLSIRARNYVMSCKKYVVWYPKDAKRVKDCDTGITNIYYHSGHKRQAIKHLKILAFKYPKYKEGKASIELLIPLVKNDKKALMQLASSFLKVPYYKKGAMGNKLRGLQRGSEKEAIAAEKDVLKRAKRYETQARKYPKDPDVDKLWYNAAVDYVKGGDITSALRAYVVIVKKFPKTSQAKTSLLQIARINEKQLSYGKASGYYRLFAQKYPKDKLTAGALSRSCDLLIAINSSKAPEVCTAFAARYPDASSGFINRMIVNAERSRRYKTMITLIRKNYLPVYKLSPNDRIVTLNRIYRAYKGKGPEAARAKKEMLGIFSSAGGAVSGEALRYIGELYFLRTAAYIPKFKALKLQGGTIDNLLKSIQKKAVAFQELEKAFSGVLATKDAYWGVAALYQLGYANEIYASDLDNPPKIKGASIEDVRKELRPQVMERKKLANARYNDAFGTVNKFKIYNIWSVKVANALARIAGKKFQYDDYVFLPDFLGTEIPVNLVSSLTGKR